MKPARVLFFGLVLFPCAALAATAARVPAFKTVGDWQCSPSGFGNLIATACWFYGGCYLLYAARKAHQRHKAKQLQPDAAAVSAGTAFFILSGLMLVAYPFLISFVYSMDHQLNHATVPPGGGPRFIGERNETALLFEKPLMFLALAAAFLPWLMLIFRKNLRHLRRQGVIGLGLVFLPPCMLFLAFMLIMKFFG
ncbi:MAG: hypothetical protein IT560_07540 [Alphaproteobacteria bacterium]|nr:hypothetical protein [Alphaproteobacteria bacterium]